MRVMIAALTAVETLVAGSVPAVADIVANTIASKNNVLL